MIDTSKVKADKTKKNWKSLQECRKSGKIGPYLKKTDSITKKLPASLRPKAKRELEDYLKGKNNNILAGAALIIDPTKQSPHETALRRELKGWTKPKNLYFKDGELKKMKKEDCTHKSIDFINWDKKYILCAKHTNNNGGNQDSDGVEVEKTSIKNAIEFLNNNPDWNVFYVFDGNYYENKNLNNLFGETHSRLHVGGNELVEELKKI